MAKGAANVVLDQYSSAASKTGNTSSKESAEFLKDVLNGRRDLNGNQIDDRYED